MGKNKQLAINMVASYLSMGISLCISFFLTPFIVESLGSEAYGFISLSSNIIGYFSLVTIALNAMAGRFIMLKYVEGDKNGANAYFSSVFFSNLILGAFILITLLVTTIYLEYILEIPNELILDVKLLFILMSISSVISLVTGTLGIATFIKNRLDLSNTRSIVGSLLNATILLSLFSFFTPHIWYMGISSLIGVIYIAFTNLRFLRKLTPDLLIALFFFNISKVWELISSGAWNVLTKLASILGHELDLLFANIFIGAMAMGTFSITKNIPFLVLSINAAASGVFAPIFTRLYAEKNNMGLIREINKSIRILGFVSCITITCVFILGEDFYHLWLPSQDAVILQKLTIVGMLALPVTLPNEALWNIFTITNKLKFSAIYTLIDNTLVFLIVLGSMYFFNDTMSKLFALAGTRAVLGNFRGLFFLPIFGAHCIGEKKTIFYTPIIKSTLCICLSCCICFFLGNIIYINNWLKFLCATIIIVIVCVTIGYFIILNKSDKKYIKLFIVNKIHR